MVLNGYEGEATELMETYGSLKQLVLVCLLLIPCVNRFPYEIRYNW